MQSEDIMNIAIKDLTIAEWDTRKKRQENPEELQGLANSLKEHGFINPITCVKVGKKYRVIAGRRRLAAAKLIGLKTVPVYVNKNVTNEKTITLLENLAREDLTDTEAGRGFVAVYESEGYPATQAIHGVKSIDNWFSNNNSNKVDWEKHKQFMLLGDKRKDQNPLAYNEKFVSICKSVSYTPKYQYQLMQLVTQIDPEVLDYAEKKGISTDKKILLTKKPLRPHPKIQKQLIDELTTEDFSNRKKATELINQSAMDLESGYIGKDDSGGYYRNQSGRKEKIKEGDKIVKPLEIRIYDMLEALHKLLFQVTDRALSKGELQYTDKMINDSKDYRLGMIKSALNDTTLLALENDLILNKLWTDEMLEMIDQEINTRKLKQKLFTK